MMLQHNIFVLQQHKVWDSIYTRIPTIHHHFPKYWKQDKGENIFWHETEAYHSIRFIANPLEATISIYLALLPTIINYTGPVARVLAAVEYVSANYLVADCTLRLTVEDWKQFLVRKKVASPSDAFVFI